MSTVEHLIETDLNRIPLVRRILEIMSEKGDAFTIRAFAARLGISREYLRLMTNGERPIAPAMLTKIAEGLGMTVVRLKQLDTVKQEQELQAFLKGKARTKVMIERAESIAFELVRLAQGATERAYSLKNLGRVQFLKQKYDDAHQTWLQALELAKSVYEKFEDTTLLHPITENLMISYCIRKEFSGAEEMLQHVERVAATNFKALGMIAYTRMRIQEMRGEIKLAREYAYRSLEYFQRTENSKQIGTAYINVAHFEFETGDYRASANALEQAMKYAEGFEDILVHVVKDYVKTLLKLREFESARSVIQTHENMAKDYPLYWGKLQIMKTVAFDDPSFADRLVQDGSANVQIRYFASKCLLEFYALKGNAEMALSYYEKVRIFSNTKSEFLEEVGF
ncbi:helix-turn-helix domain-containing protein [Tumebacillus flagellatus]|uniref:HTH cro/C1-type domain-containing protein n=1 Tax=Tumebacillus flagellatus TaxID=1157490 RepID=A0A074MHJ2_9BACL|nr:helix-turn-helix transcriptional regulator [Tumebacillus flagellatus]KEO85122.1 hypothetical protein EL26_00755 [Tumebacillus flagellatus]